MFLVVVLLNALSINSNATATNNHTPNIVFIIADDCTFRDIGCYGGQAHTPHMDGLATEGMRFTRCFQAAPMCSPTRHNIYTGQYPVKSGAYPNHTRVDEGTASIVQYLRPLGYRVAHHGKSHVKPASVFDWESLGKDKTIDFDVVDQFLMDCSQRSDPFCLLLCSNEPHSPWNKGDPSAYPIDEIKLPPYYVDTPETRDGMSRYLAEITYFDWQVGQMLSQLEKHQLTDNTLVMVVSEQGNSLPFAKWTCYDHGLQSACIVRWPGQITAGSVNTAMIEYVDFLPTFIEIAGGQPDKALDGASLLDVFAGKNHHKAFVYGEMTTRGIINGSPHYGIRSVRSEDYKYIWNFTPEIAFQNACTKSREFQSWVAAAEKGDSWAAELVDRYQHRPDVELYDINEDPLEQNNLAANPEYADVCQSLRAKLEAWMEACDDEGQATELAALERQGNRVRKDRRAKGKQAQNKRKAANPAVQAG
ncbi:MAG: sulfatase [Planctomycetota bacterium]